jgi:hypothetical protein
MAFGNWGNEEKGRIDVRSSAGMNFLATNPGAVSESATENHTHAT